MFFIKEWLLGRDASFMKRKNNIYYSSLFIRFLLFYLAVFLIPFLLVTYLIFNVNAAMIYAEQERITSENISRLCSLLENTLKEADSISYSLAFNPSIIPNIMERNVEGSNECIRTIKSFVSKSSNHIYNDIIVYFPGITSNLVYSSNGTQTINILETYLPLSDENDAPNYVEYIKEINSPVLVPITNKLNEKETGDLIYINPIYFSLNNWYMTAFFCINGSNIDNISSDIIGDLRGSVYIFNNGGRLIYSYKNNSGDEERPIKFEDVYKIRSSNSEYLVFNGAGRNKDFQVVTVIPKTEFELLIAVKQVVMKKIALIVGTAGIAMVLFFAVRTYMPIYRINKAIEKYKVNSANKKYNELESIQDALLNAINENRRIGYYVQDVIKIVREQLLCMIINGDINKCNVKNLDDLLIASQVNLPGPYYNVMCLFLPRGVSHNVRQDIVRTIQQNIVWHPGSVFALCIENSSYITIVASLGPGTDLRIFQERLASTIHEILLHKFGLEGTIFVGKAYNDIFNINKSYIEASSMIEKYGDMPNRTLFFDEVADSESDSSTSVQQKEQYLIQSIKKGNKNTALESLNAIVDEITNKTRTTTMVKFKLIKLISDIADILVQIGFWKENKIDVLVEPLVSYVSSPKLIAMLSDIIVNACIYVKTGDQKQSTDIMKNVKEYIERNFWDSNLNLDQVADIFNVSPLHLSREFKKYTGLNFVEYVSFLRINEAKQLLAKTDLKIKDIVSKIGYNDVSNFIRKFKISEGITPGQYRELYNSKASVDSVMVENEVSFEN